MSRALAWVAALWVLCTTAAFGQTAQAPRPAVEEPGVFETEVRMGDNAPVVNKSIGSIRTMRIRGVLLQQTDYSCGAAAVATILREHFKRDIDEMQAIQGMLKFADAETVRATGFSLLDMRKYVESIGLRGSGFKVGPERLFELKVPVITLIDRNGYKHFVVVKKASDGRVHIADPSYGNRSIRLEEFIEMWNGVLLAITGPGADPNSILTKTDTPFLKYRADASRLDVRRAALDFGFRAFDLF